MRVARFTFKISSSDLWFREFSAGIWRDGGFWVGLPLAGVVQAILSNKGDAGFDSRELEIVLKGI